MMFSGLTRTALGRRFSTVRLSKRMGELDVCSRREADRLIEQGRVVVNKELAKLGLKVDSSLPIESIEILPPEIGESTSYSRAQSSMPEAIVLNKPPGYVSGQADHGHRPAVRLLTEDRVWARPGQEKFILDDFYSWEGFAPAGRLDLDSGGLLVFSQSGVIAKKLIGDGSKVEKEYLVKVSPAVQEMRRELDLDSDFRLPDTTLDLTRLIQGHNLLLGDTRPLRPCKAKWVENGALLQVVLKEGRKRQIRRACRELLGYHVIELERVRIGPIHIGDLPVGHWRPLDEDEIESILKS